MPSIEVTSVDDLDALVNSIRSSAQRTVRRLKEVMASETEGLQVLRLMKFSGVGHHPTEDRPLNIIEQINQTFTYLASADAARWVLQHHPEVKGLRLNLGTHRGFDLESLEPNMVVAEVFAATHPHSNDKVRKDVRRLVEQAPEIPHRYVFFSCPEFKTLSRQSAFERDGVQVWSLPADQVTE
jgi:hypothetical protein